jgi:hypothetical protein
MTARVSSPSVCVVDDEEEEFRTILDVLARLGLPAVHFRGDDLDGLPPEGKPLAGLRLIFTDLNINNASHKMALGYTVQVFHRIVSGEHGPVFAVVWSKHAEETDATDGKSNGQKFEEILFSEYPEYRGRVFLQTMPKPTGLSHDADSVDRFEKEVTKLLDRWPAFDLLLRWESTLQDATLKAAEGLLKLARAELLPDKATSAAELADKMAVIFKSLVKSQAVTGRQVTNPTSLLASTMAALVSDQLEHSPEITGLNAHDTWLGTSLPKTPSHQCEINGMLLIGMVPANCTFTPGTVYRVGDSAAFETTFGGSTKALIADCFDRQKDDEAKSNYERWKTVATPVVVELSPDCDVHQGHRKTVFLLGGVIVPAVEGGFGRRTDAWMKLPPMMIDDESDTLEQASSESGVQIDGRGVNLVFCARYKAALRAKDGEPAWLKPLFRLRDLPTASLRNWAASHASRVGYVSL